MVGLVAVGEKQHVVPEPQTIFAIRTAAHAESLARVIAPFAQRGIVPMQLSCRSADDMLLIDIAIASLDPGMEDILLHKLRSLPLVDRASLLGPVR